MKRSLNVKKIQKTYGYLNYYLSFSKYFSSLLFRFIKEPDKIRSFMFELIKLDYVAFKIPNNRKLVEAYSDATPTQIGGITSTKETFSIRIKDSNIMLAEKTAAIVTISLH